MSVNEMSVNEMNNQWQKEFYRFLFPNIRKPGPKGPQDVFSEYGCVEALNVENEHSPGKYVVTSKKQKPLLEIDKDICGRLLVPKQPVLPLMLSDVKTILYDVNLEDWYIKRTAYHPDKKRFLGLFANTEQQLCNLAADHPDVYHGTFLSLFSQYFPYRKCDGVGYIPNNNARFDCGDKLPDMFLHSSSSQSRFAKTLKTDTMLCDVPEHLLTELLLEGITEHTKTLSYDPLFTGGCLSYQGFKERGETQHGLLAYSQGSAMDELNLQLLCTQTLPTFSNDEKEDDQRFDPTIVLGSSYRFLLNGTILQTEAVTPQSLQTCIIGARSHYQALMVSLDAEGVRCDDQNETKLTFDSKDCMQKLGALQTTSVLSSLSISPYIQGEGVVATYDGQLYLWDANAQCQAKANKQKTSRGIFAVKLSDELTSGDSKWLQTAYGSHPRQIYVASRSGVHNVDMRIKSMSSARLMHVPDNANFKDEMIMAILGGTQFQPFGVDGGNEFQCIVATQSNLLLLDQRYCKAPLLKWSLTLRSPCQHLTSSTFMENNQLTSVIVAANQKPQELHCFQTSSNFSSVSNACQSTSGLKRNPPTSACHPRSLGSLADVRRSVAAIPVSRCHRDIVRRLEQPVIGTAAYSYRDRFKTNSVVVLQATGCGDVFYQSLEQRHPCDEYEIGNVTTGLSGYSVRAAENKAKCNEAEKMYAKWADEAALSFESGRRENVSNRSIRPVITSVECEADHRLLESLSSYRGMKARHDCVLCEESCCAEREVTRNACDFDSDQDRTYEKESPTSPGSSDNDEEWTNAQPTPVDNSTIDGDVCPRCLVDVHFSDCLQQCHRSGLPLTTESRSQSENLFDDVTPSDVPNLNLIDVSRTDNQLGRVLVSTWDGTYEDLWDELRREQAGMQERERKKTELAVLDLHSKRQESSENDQESDDKAVNSNVRCASPNLDSSIVSENVVASPQKTKLLRPFTGNFDFAHQRVSPLTRSKMANPRQRRPKKRARSENIESLTPESGCVGDAREAFENTVESCQRLSEGNSSCVDDQPSSSKIGSVDTIPEQTFRDALTNSSATTDQASPSKTGRKNVDSTLLSTLSMQSFLRSPPSSPRAVRSPISSPAKNKSDAKSRVVDNKRKRRIGFL